MILINNKKDIKNKVSIEVVLAPLEKVRKKREKEKHK